MDSIGRLLGREIAKVGGKLIASHGLSSKMPEPEGVEDFKPAGSADGLPSRVDLRKYCTPVEDQSESNSCCANAVAGAYEYLATKAALKNGDDVGDISRLFIYFVGRKSDLQSQGKGNLKVKDEGMSIQGAINALKSKGACLERDFPFELSCVNETPDPEKFDQAMNYKISNGIKIPVEELAMKQCLAEGYPFVFGLKLTQRFFSPGSKGIISIPNLDDPQSASHGLHAMLCVGYSEPDEVFIVRNSWGPGWGHNGYCYVPYSYIANSDFNFCGQYAIKGLTDYDLTPETPCDSSSKLLDGEDDGEDEPEIEHQEKNAEDDIDSDNEYDDFFDRQAEIKRVFQKFDADGNGNLSRNELKKAIECCGIYLPKMMIAGLSKTYNTDGEAGISFEEFTKITDDLQLKF